jgi:hypothetical protein
MGSVAPSEETLRQNLAIQWQDHFHTRAQTWKALEITGLLAVGLVGLDWRVDSRVATFCASVLLAIVATFGMLITLRHRAVEVGKFKRIAAIEKQLGLGDGEEGPKPIHWWWVLLFWKTNTSLFILRMNFAILVFAIGFGLLRLFS